MPLHVPLRIVIFFSGATNADLGLPTIVDLAALAKTDLINEPWGLPFDRNRKEASNPVIETCKNSNRTQNKSKLKRMEIFRKNRGQEKAISDGNSLCRDLKAGNLAPSVAFAHHLHTKKQKTVLAHH